jgi:thiamine biosynthesis lipoprotein
LTGDSRIRRLNLNEVFLLRIRTLAPITLALLASVSAGAADPDRTVLAMGTALRVTGRAEGAAVEAALAEVARIEAACSTWREDSAWSRLNRAGGQPVALDPEWLDLLEAAQRLQAETGGAFDPALGPLVAAWNLRGTGRTPSADELAAARAASGAHLLVLDRGQGAARFLHRDGGLEEGGFVKGYALDRAMGKIPGPGRILLDFGGQLLARGRAAVSIADPAARGRAKVSIRLEDASLATSGASERGRHILDPRTGLPCAAWGSASVVRPSALEADALSTALFVMGPDQGLAWAAARRLPACFLLNDGRARMTREFKALLLSKEIR